MATGDMKVLKEYHIDIFREIMANLSSLDQKELLGIANGQCWLNIIELTYVPKPFSALVSI